MGKDFDRVNFQELETKLSITFSNQTLLLEAFTHSSYVNEHHRKNLANNERLEFLGDAVLELLVSDYLFHRYPELQEGDLTRMRANIVCEESLFHFAEKLELSKYVLLGKGEERTGGRNRQALLADVFEALLGALYLDQGIEACRQFLDEHVFSDEAIDVFSYVMDYKTKLQELVQENKGSTLSYAIISETGPSHRKTFVAEVVVNGTMKSTGTGRTKKEAEQQAAKKMLELLNK